MKTRQMYKGQKRRARLRGIQFDLTYEEWLNIWQISGHFHERGCRKGQYNMARNGDIGPYAVGNVSIIRHEENSREASTERICSEQTRHLIGSKLFGNKSRTGQENSEDHCRKISKALQRYLRESPRERGPDGRFL